jgi:hypothetical protein
MTYRPYFTAGLLTAVILLLFSCDDRFDINFLEEEQQLNTLYSDTFTISTDLIALDTVETTYAPQLLFGQVYDAKFGTTRAESYANIVLRRDSIRFTDATNLSPVYDSVVLIGPVTYTHGDISQKQTVFVHEMANILDTAAAVTYKRQDRQAVSRLLGSGEYPTAVKKDSLRIRLSDEFGRALFAKGGEQELRKQEFFAQYFKGIRISSETNSQNAAVVGLNSSLTKIALFYRKKVTDTIASRVEFAVNSSSNPAYIKYYNYIASDWSKTPILSRLRSGAPFSTAQSNNEAYIQCGTGVVTRIRFPHLNKLAQGRRIKVNRAEFRLQPADEVFAIPNRVPPGQLIYAMSDANGYMVRNAKNQINYVLAEVLPTSESYDQRAQLVYNKDGRMYYGVNSNSSYTPGTNLTTYVQNLIDGKSNDYGLIMRPAEREQVGKVDKLIFNDAQSKSGNRIKLLIYYTVVNP